MKAPPLTIGNFLLLLWTALLPIQTRLFLHRGELAGGVWGYGTLSVYATDVLLVAAVIVMAIHERTAFWKRPARLAIPVVLGACIIAALTLFSSLNARDAGVTFGFSLHLALGLLAWWAIAKCRIPMEWFAYALIISVSLESIIVLAQFVAQSVPASTLFGLSQHTPATLGDAVVETAQGRFLRGYGTLPHPNIAAGWIALGLLFTSGLYLRSRDRLERAVFLALFCLESVGLFLTFSRAGFLTWLAILLILVAGVLLRERREAHALWHIGFQRRDLPLGLKMLKLTIVSVLLLGVLLSFFSPLVRGRQEAVGRLEAKSVNERLTQLSEARTLIARSWLFGVGAGNYTKAVYEDVDRNRESWAYQPIHNVPLLVLTELGVLGFAVVLWFVVVTVRASLVEHRRRWREHQPNDIAWSAIVSLGLVLLFGLSLADHYLWSLPFGVMMTWLVLGLWSKSLHED